MDALKKSIFTEIRSRHEKSKDLSDEQLNKLIFHHSNGYRLLFQGFLILKNIFTVYSFEVPITLKARHYTGMDKMASPYFITSRRLVLFSEMDAVIIKLQGGIEGFLENCRKFDS